MKLFVFCCILQTISIRIAFAIVGGEQAQPGQHPYQVSLFGYGRHVCGGSIINPNTILTAGHCVDGISPTFFKIKTQDQTTYSALSFTFADNYDVITRKNDLVKVRLSTPIQYNSLVDQVVLSPDDPTPGKQVYEVCGDPLYVYNVDITPMTTCQSKWGLLGCLVDDTKMCIREAGDLTSDGCFLVADKKVVGLSNWRNIPDFPPVYTKTSSYLTWINQNC